MSKRKVEKKKLRVILLADESLLPDGELKDFSEKQRELRKTEFDVRDAIEALGHDVVSIGVSDDLSTIRGAIDAHKPISRLISWRNSAASVISISTSQLP